jgi:hypothetical protein
MSQTPPRCASRPLVLDHLQDAQELDEACEGAGIMAGRGTDALEPVANRVGMEVHLLRRRATFRSACEKARTVFAAVERSSSDSACSAPPFEAITARVVAFAPTSAHSSEDRSSSDAIGRTDEV